MGDSKLRRIRDALASGALRADDAVAAPAQRAVEAMAARGIGLPAILRDAVFHSMASLCLCIGAVAWEGMTGSALFLAALAAVIAPKEYRQWKKHSDRARASWSQCLAETCYRESESRKSYFLGYRIAFLGVVAWNAMDCVVGSEFTLTDAACLLMTVVFGTRLYLERCVPVPPGAGKKFSRLVPQA